MQRCVISILLLSISIIFACASKNHVIKKTDITGFKEIKKGTSLYKKGCYNQAIEHFLRAHELFVISDNLGGVAISINNIGKVYKAHGEIATAIKFFDESYQIYSYIKDIESAVRSLSNKAAALIEIGSFKEASNILTDAENIAISNKKLFSTLLKTRGILLIREKKFKSAEKALKKALNKVSSKNFSEIAAINFAIGKLMVETNRYDNAIKYFKTALSIDQASGAIKETADDLAIIGKVYYNQQKYSLAVNFFIRSIKIYALIDKESKVYEIMEFLNKSSEKAEVNISLTKSFVKRWREGKSLESLCE